MLTKLRKKLNIKIQTYTTDEALGIAMSLGDLQRCPLCLNIIRRAYCCSKCGYSGSDKDKISIYDFETGKTSYHNLK